MGSMSPARQCLSRRQAMRRALNLVNGTTAAGLLTARLGRVPVRSGPGGLLLAGGWSLPLPRAAAFTLGNVILYRSRVSGAFAVEPASALLRHEAKHRRSWPDLPTAATDPVPLPAERPVTALFGAEKSRNWPLEG